MLNLSNLCANFKSFNFTLLFMIVRIKILKEIDGVRSYVSYFTLSEVWGQFSPSSIWTIESTWFLPWVFFMFCTDNLLSFEWRSFVRNLLLKISKISISFGRKIPIFVLDLKTHALRLSIEQNNQWLFSLLLQRILSSSCHAMNFFDQKWSKC